VTLSLACAQDEILSVGSLVTKRLVNISRYLSRHDAVAVKISRRIETLGPEEEDWDAVPPPDPPPPIKEEPAAVSGVKEEMIDIEERDLDLENSDDTLSAPDEELENVPPPKPSGRAQIKLI
jgi:hypothetical protein